MESDIKVHNYMKYLAFMLLMFLLQGMQVDASVPLNCDDVVKSNIQSPTAKQSYQTAYCNMKKENYSEATRLFEDVEPKLPLLSDYNLYYRAFSLHKLGRDDEAIKLYNKLLDKYDSSTLNKRIKNDLAGIYMEKGEYKKSEELYQSLFNKEKDVNAKAEYLYNIALSQAGQKQYQQATDNFKKVWINFATTKHSKSANLEIIKLQKLHDVKFITTPNDYFNRAQKYFASSEWALALANYRKSPQTQVVKINSAVCFFKLGNYTKALEILDDINSSKSLYWQAKIRAKQNKNALASKIFIQLSKSHPKSYFAPEALYNAARLHEIDNKLDRAIEIYEQLIEKYPHTEFAEEASWNLGWIYYKKDDHKKANRIFTGFINSGSSFNATRSEYWAARTLEKLGQSRKAESIYKRLSGRFFPSYYPYLAQLKSNYNDESKIKSEDLVPDDTNSEKVAKAQLLIELGMLNDALLEIKTLHKTARTTKDFIDLSVLYGKANDFYNAIQVVQGINHPEALKLSYPLGYSEIVNKYAKAYGIDEFIVYSIMREESRYQKDVVSPAKAIGLMQLMPDTGRRTAKELGIQGFTKKKLYDPEMNIRLGTYYIKKVLDEFGGNVFYALGGYNAGPHRIYEWQNRFPGLNMDEFVEEVPFRETRNYIRRVLRTYGAYKTLYSDQAGN